MTCRVYDVDCEAVTLPFSFVYDICMYFVGNNNNNNNNNKIIIIVKQVIAHSI